MRVRWAEDVDKTPFSLLSLGFSGHKIPGWGLVGLKSDMNDKVNFDTSIPISTLTEAANYRKYIAQAFQLFGAGL